MSDYFREGWTERIRYALTADDAPLNLTGMSVALEGKDKKGHILIFTGTIGIDDATTGIVYLDPSATDLASRFSPFTLRWKVTDTNGKVAYFPRAEPLVWIIQNP